MELLLPETLFEILSYLTNKCHRRLRLISHQFNTNIIAYFRHTNMTFTKKYFNKVSSVPNNSLSDFLTYLSTIPNNALAEFCSDTLWASNKRTCLPIIDLINITTIPIILISPKYTKVTQLYIDQCYTYGDYHIKLCQNINSIIFNDHFNINAWNHTLLNVTKLDIKFRKNTTIDTHLFTYFPNLQYLKLHAVKLMGIIPQLEKITQLEIYFVIDKPIINHLITLTSLHMHYIDNNVAIDNLVNLSSLEIFWCFSNIYKQITDFKNLTNIATDRPLHINNNLSTLTSLNISGGFTIETNLGPLSNLRSLKINLINIPIVGLSQNMKFLTNITTLYIINHNSFFDPFVNAFTNLRSLNICTSETISDNTIKNLTNLTYLRIHKLYNNEKQITITNNAMLQLSNLRELKIDCEISVDILNNLTQLTKLSIRNCYKHATEINTLTNLKTLTIYYDADKGYTYSDNTNLLDTDITCKHKYGEDNR